MPRVQVPSLTLIDQGLTRENGSALSRIPALGNIVGTPPLHTARLNLLPLAVEHAEEMAAALSDPALHTYIGGAPSTPGALRARYERLVAGSPDPSVTWLNWVLRLRADGCLTGTVQATVAEDRGLAEIAWVVGTPWQGRGLASEAARELVDWLGRRSSVRTVVAHIHPDHHASAAVATAAGLSPTAEEQEGEVRWQLSLPTPPAAQTPPPPPP
jgi:RimJ/RimL family protein N-acetyltransferase